MTCQICLNSNRKPRFSSLRLTICQWCITELCNIEKFPSEIIELKRESLQRKYKEKIEHEINIIQNTLKTIIPKELGESTLIQAENSALNEIKRKESVLTWIYRSFFDETDRVLEVKKLANIKKSEVIASHQIEINNYNNKINLLNSKKIELSTIDSKTEKDIENYLINISEIKKNRTKEEKILRAYQLGILNYSNQIIERLSGQQDEDLKRFIRQQDKYQCICCNRGTERGELHVHHIIPLYRFGTNSNTNLVTLCHPCHNKQHPEFNVTRSYAVHRRKLLPTFVAVDIETTGLSNQDSIIEIAAALFNQGKLVDVFESFVYTNIDIPCRVTELTGITNELIKNAPKENIVFKDFSFFIKNYRLVFHNAKEPLKNCRFTQQSFQNRVVNFNIWPFFIKIAGFSRK